MVGTSGVMFISKASFLTRARCIHHSVLKLMVKAQDALTNQEYKPTLTHDRAHMKFQVVVGVIAAEFITGLQLALEKLHIKLGRLRL
jgi:hypothetical protein